MIHKCKEINKKTNKFTSTKTRWYVRRFTKFTNKLNSLCHFSKKIVFGINLWNVSCAYVNHCMHLWILKHFTQIAKYVDFTPHLLYSSGSYNRSQHALAPPNHIYYYFFSKLLTYSCGSHLYFIWKYDINVIKTSFSNKTSYLLVSTISGF